MRTPSAAWLAAARSVTATPVHLIEILGSNPERIITWIGDKDWGGHTWSGLGHVHELAPLTFSPDTLLNTMRIILGVADPTRLSRLANDIRGQEFNLYLSFLAANKDLIDPELFLHGIMYPGPVSGKQMEIVIESRFNRPRLAAVDTYSEASQRRRNSADRCFFDVTNKTVQPLERTRYVAKSGLGF